MKNRLILLAILITLWLISGCRDQPSPSPTITKITTQPTDTSGPTKMSSSPTLTPTAGKPAWLPVPPENPNVVKLTENIEWKNKKPVWSPDGSQIAFLSNRECVKLYDGTYDEWANKSRCWEWDLYLMDADGSNEIRLTDVQFRDGMSSAWLRWSPDGERIAFTYSNYLDLPFERVLSFSLDKAKKAPLGLEDMEALVDEGEDYQVSSFEWSPDGKKYAYDYYRYWDGPYYDRWDIVIIDEESGEEVFRKISTSESLCKFRAWSPSGEAIFVACFGETEGNWDVHIDRVDLTTWDQSLLLENAYNPILSPDGKWILFTSTETGLSELFHVESEEVIPFSFPDDQYFYYSRSWSPDGKWIAFGNVEYNGFYQWSNISLYDISWLEMEWEE
jgi:Tol biopolymer transport system component